MRDRLRELLAQVVTAVPDVVPLLSADTIDAIKTADSYFRQLWKKVKQLYGKEITRGEFVDSVANIVEEQITKAYRQALRDEGEDPKLVETTYADNVQEIIISEYSHIDTLSVDIKTAAYTESGYEGFRSRIELWANRYNDAYNRAIVDIGLERGGRLEWVLGATEEHCESCSALNGIVAYAKDWNELGVKPQQPPNAAIECGGWKCDCELRSTNKRVTRKAKDRITAARYG